MRVLLTAFGTRGDVQPLVALGLELRSGGHEVVLGASPGFGEWVRSHGLGFHAIGSDIEAWIRDHGDLVSRPLHIMPATIQFLREDADRAFGQTLEAARGAELIVSGVHAAAPSVAEALGIPHRTLLYCPQLLASRYHPPPGVPWLGLPAAANRGLWWGWSRVFEFIFGGVLGRRRREWGLPPIRDLASHFAPGDSIVAADAALGELSADAPPAAIQIPALSLPVAGALDAGLERFLEAGEPPVALGFGSMPDSDPMRTTRLFAEALEAAGRRGVILGGWAGLGNEALPPTIHLVRSAPHALLLPRVALAVHHGGAGTTTAAARAGIPQIVVPHVVDQLYWGHQVHQRGLGGRPIPRNALTAPGLAHAMSAVLADGGTRDRARRLAVRLAGFDGAPELRRILERLVSEGARRAA